MTINEMRFMYAGQVSDSYDVMLCSIGAQNNPTNDESSEVITTKSPFKESWDFHRLEYNAPLQFSITIAKIHESGEYGSYFDAQEQRNIKKWLCKPKRNWLQIDQDDLGLIFYYCIITNPRPVNVGTFSAGFQFDVICDTYHAWSELEQLDFVVENTRELDLYNDFDYDEYILYPTLTITPTVNGDITIINNTTQQTISLTNCISNEVITMDGKNEIIKSSNGRVLINNWNKEFLEMVNDVNNITITGSCNISFEYRLPIRVGG